MIAGREAAALKDIVKHQQSGHYYHHGAHELRSPGLPGNQRTEFVRPAEKEIEHRAGGKAYGQMPAGYCAVRDYAVHELGKPVNYAHKA